MTIAGWEQKYAKILREFGYDKKSDIESAKKLNTILKKSSTKKLKQLINKKTVFVIGAGPSLLSSIPHLKKYHVTKIAADGATQALLENGVVPEIVVTDLDGDKAALRKAARKCIVVAHAHGDNQDKLHLVSEFQSCFGTTESKQFKKIHNFGGFTDGDRSVFLANHFDAKKIILFGMDFGTKIGKYSKAKVVDRKTKLKKLKRGKKLLEWLATKTKSELYTTSRPIKGFKKIQHKNLNEIVL
ncbi:MAG: 6-hydroxymethylpterin diphosphokinase MptE-like protein [Nitrosopumilaceae archaeon]